MIVAFHTPTIDIRGTCVALYDYAHYNEVLLGNTSIIVVPLSSVTSIRDMALRKFVKRFRVVFYKDLDEVLVHYNCDILYCIKYGTNDGVRSAVIKTCVHCVFDMSEPHGDVYVAISKQIASKYNNESLFVPHMIGLKPGTDKMTLRNQLNIPENAVVFSRYGGMDTFNLEVCWDVIDQVATAHPNKYFLFINTPRFSQRPNIIHLPPITSDYDKNLFIGASDAYLECSSLGHSFGLAIGEYSVNNKPIIAYNGWTWNTAHISILGDKALYFANAIEFRGILESFDPAEYAHKDLNCYKSYTPELVMAEFERVFLTSESD